MNTQQPPFKLQPRRNSIAGGYESDESFVDNNRELAAWLLDNYQAMTARNTSQDFGVNYDGARYKAVETGTICRSCAFLTMDKSCMDRNREQLPCSPEDRTDRRNVIWVKADWQ